MFQVTNDESYGCIICGEAPCICIDGNILDDLKEGDEMKKAKRRKLEDERAQLLADIVTAEYNLNELCYTSERYPGELDQVIGAFSRGIAYARTRLAEIEQELDGEDAQDFEDEKRTLAALHLTRLHEAQEE